MSTTGFTNERNPTPATLTENEEQVREELATLSHHIHSIRNELHVLELRRAVLRNGCDHRVFNDTEGFPYDARHCVICGSSLGQV